MAVLIIGIIALFVYLQKKSKNSDVARIQKLRKGTDTKKFSSDIMYQKMYVFFLRFPITRFYLLKIRRRLEINNADDEFSVRLQASKIIAKAFAIIIPLHIFLTPSDFSSLKDKSNIFNDLLNLIKSAIDSLPSLVISLFLSINSFIGVLFSLI